MVSLHLCCRVMKYENTEEDTENIGQGICIKVIEPATCF